nr:hypothetical protein [Tanacetum cinerariifolium]
MLVGPIAFETVVAFASFPCGIQLSSGIDENVGQRHVEYAGRDEVIGDDGQRHVDFLRPTVAGRNLKNLQERNESFTICAFLARQMDAIVELAAAGNSSRMYDNIRDSEFSKSANMDGSSVGTSTMNTGNVFGSTTGLSSKVSFVIDVTGNPIIPTTIGSYNINGNNNGATKVTTGVVSTGVNETTTNPNTSVLISSGPTSYAKLVIGKPSRKSVSFRTLITPARNGVNVDVPLESVRAISEWFTNTAYGFFLEKRVAYPIVANCVRNTWDKYRLVKSLINSSIGLFFFQFSPMDGLDSMLQNVWVKLYGVLMTAFSEDGLSAIATKHGTSLTLDSYVSDA